MHALQKKSSHKIDTFQQLIAILGECRISTAVLMSLQKLAIVVEITAQMCQFTMSATRSWNASRFVISFPRASPGEPDWTNKSGQAYSCPRDERLSAIICAQLKTPPELRTSQQYRIET